MLFGLLELNEKELLHRRKNPNNWKQQQLTNSYKEHKKLKNYEREQ